ncbi:MAG TPA: hypothetical protein VH396_20325 [Chitinophagaceae bacterium]
MVKPCPSADRDKDKVTGFMFFIFMFCIVSWGFSWAARTYRCVFISYLTLIEAASPSVVSLEQLEIFRGESINEIYISLPAARHFFDCIH